MPLTTTRMRRCEPTSWCRRVMQRCRAVRAPLPFERYSLPGLSAGAGRIRRRCWRLASSDNKGTDEQSPAACCHVAAAVAADASVRLFALQIIMRPCWIIQSCDFRPEPGTSSSLCLLPPSPLPLLQKLLMSLPRWCIFYVAFSLALYIIYAVPVPSLQLRLEYIDLVAGFLFCFYRAPFPLRPYITATLWCTVSKRMHILSLFMNHLVEASL